MTKEIITYENSKCACCKKVYMTFIVINSSEWKDHKFVICGGCARDVKESLDSLRKNAK